MKKAAKKASKEKLAGIITHFYGGLKVAVIKAKWPFALGDELSFRGATTDFKQIVESMQLNHRAINKAPKGRSIGLKVKKRVRQGDEVYFSQ